MLALEISFAVTCGMVVTAYILYAPKHWFKNPVGIFIVAYMVTMCLNILLRSSIIVDVITIIVGSILNIALLVTIIGVQEKGFKNHEKRAKDIAGKNNSTTA